MSRVNEDPTKIYCASLIGILVGYDHSSFTVSLYPTLIVEKGTYPLINEWAEDAVRDLLIVHEGAKLTDVSPPKDSQEAESTTAVSVFRRVQEATQETLHNADPSCQVRFLHSRDLEDLGKALKDPKCSFENVRQGLLALDRVQDPVDDGLVRGLGTDYQPSLLDRSKEPWKSILCPCLPPLEAVEDKSSPVADSVPVPQ